MWLGLQRYCPFETFHSVLNHSIGVALLAWRFTHDKKTTLAALFHDIASPAFKHCIDVMNGDSEKQESIEARTSEIIRNSRSIMRQLKKDGILAGEVSDCKLYPIADNDMPGLSADRLEYTLSNGYFQFDTWTLDQIRRFSDNLTVLQNEHGIDELGFRDLEIAKEFTTENLTLSVNYHNDRARATMQFIADIIKSMELRGYLTMDDLYIMSEREVIDWILSCGDKTLSGAFRNFQRATSVYSSSTMKKIVTAPTPSSKSATSILSSPAKTPALTTSVSLNSQILPPAPSNIISTPSLPNTPVLISSSHPILSSQYVIY